MVKNTDCINWAPHYETVLKDTMFCAGRPGGKVDSCKGDSGGPLIVGGTSSSIKDENDYFDYDLSALGAERATSTTDSNIAIIYGIVSFGPKRCGQPKVSGIYTRVNKYLPWISSHMKGKIMSSFKWFAFEILCLVSVRYLSIFFTSK